MSALRPLLFVTPGFPAHDDETDCIPALQVFLQAVREAEPDQQIFVATLHYPRKRTEYTWRGVQVLPLNLAKSRLMRLPAMAGIPGRLTSWLSGVEVGVVHSLWLNDVSLVANRVARRLGVPHVCTVMGQDVLRSNRYLTLASRAAQRADIQLVAPSTRALEALRSSTDKGWETAQVIPWGVERPLDETRPWSRRDVDVLGVGSLSELKRFELFAEVIKDLRSKGRVTRCEIIGDGPARAKLVRKIRSLGLDGTLQVRGALAREQVLERMERAKVLLHTSRFEAFGLVFAEALAAGMSVVSTPVGWARAGPRWRVGESRAELAEGVERMLEEAHEGVPIRSAPWAFDTARSYIAIYRDLCGLGIRGRSSEDGMVS